MYKGRRRLLIRMHFEYCKETTVLLGQNKNHHAHVFQFGLEYGHGQRIRYESSSQPGIDIEEGQRIIIDSRPLAKTIPRSHAR